MKVAAIVIASSGLVAAAPRPQGLFARAVGVIRDNLQNGGTSMSAGGPANAQAANNPGELTAAAQGIPNLTDDQKKQVQAAIQQWSLDTSLVSCSLNMLPSGQLNAADFADAADHGYVAEVDETIQKATLDALIGDMPLVQSASANLTNGTFISVVDGLRELRIRGDTPSTKSIVDLMNTNRCRPIMEAIDAYLLAGAMAIGNSTPPTAVRPQACLAVVGQTGSILTQYKVNNCTSYPKANELVRDYGQSSTFQLSNSVREGNNPSRDLTGSLGDIFPNNGGNASSSLGTQPNLFPNGFTINGPVLDAIANPVNVDLGLAQAGAGASGAAAAGAPPAAPSSVPAASVPVAPAAAGVPSTPAVAAPPAVAPPAASAVSSVPAGMPSTGFVGSVSGEVPAGLTGFGSYAGPVAPQ